MSNTTTTKTRKRKESKKTKSETERGTVAAKKNEYRAYELTVVVSPSVKADKRKIVMESIEKLVKKNGTVSASEEIGLRDLAYPIKKSLSGWYASLKMDLDPESVASLEQELFRNDLILRHLVLRI